MYELLYHELLIPFQGDHQTQAEKREIKKKYINSIIDWVRFNSPGKLKIETYNVNCSRLHIRRRRGTSFLS